MTWNSPLSIGFDWFFGMLPAAYWAYLSFFGSFFSIIFIPQLILNPNPGSLWGINEILKSFIGLYACVSMFYVTIKRSRVVKKWISIFGLLCGIILSFFVLPISLASDWRNPIFFSYALITFSPAIVAIKHIIMLTRA
jgi:hypothetical protein